MNWYNPPNGVLFHSCLFKDCSAPQYGGAMNLREISRPESTTILVSNSFFDGSDLKSSPQYGYDVSLHGTANRLSITSFDNTFSSRTLDNRIYCNTTCGTYTQNWLPNGPSPLYYDRYVSGSSTTGEDKSGCGRTSGSACKTIGYAVGECKDGQESKVIVLVGNDDLEVKMIDVGVKSVNVEGKGNTTTTVGLR